MDADRRTGVNDVFVSSLVGRISSLPPWLRLMRPVQWSKNVVVFAGLIFGGQAGNPEQVVRAVIAFAAFCLVSSSMYVFNDWHDRVEDRTHPLKRFRPIASGEISPDVALGLGISLLGVALLVASSISLAVTTVILAYALLMVIYTLRFREMPFVDVSVIAIGFVLRALAGTIAVSVTISIWLFLCTLLLALLLGMGKRRHEVGEMIDGVELKRPTLPAYRHFNLDAVVIGLATLTVLAYLMYAIAATDTTDRSFPMWITAPFVAVAIGRYLHLVIVERKGGSPELLLVSDWMLAGCIVGWAASVGIVTVF